MFSKFGRAKTLAPPFVFSVACARAGIPLLLVAPTSGGKTAIIFSAERWLGEHKEPTKRVSRIGLRGLRSLSEWLKATKYGTLLNEDYSLIGSSDWMVDMMAEIIASLSESKTFQDDGLKVDIRVDKMGFISGVQPQWLREMYEKQAFSTHIREKFIRYYVLPYAPTKEVDRREAIEILSANLNEVEKSKQVKLNSEFLEALTYQVGTTRAIYYASMIVDELSKLMNPRLVSRAQTFFSRRLGFEQSMIERDITDTGFSVNTLWHEYTMLYWCLRKGDMTRVDMMKALGVSSLRSVDRATEKTIAKGWISSRWNNGEKHYFIPDAIKERYKW